MNLLTNRESCKTNLKPILLIVAMTVISHFTFAQLKVREFVPSKENRSLQTPSNQPQEVLPQKIALESKLSEHAVKSDSIKLNSSPFLRKESLTLPLYDSVKILAPMRNRWTTDEN